jgi:hypothetical protein
MGQAIEKHFGLSRKKKKMSDHSNQGYILRNTVYMGVLEGVTNLGVPYFIDGP